MPTTRLIILGALLMLASLACSLASNPAPAGAPASTPIGSPAPTSSLPPIVPGTAGPRPTATTSVITVQTPTPFPTITATITPTSVVLPTQPPVSTGPLDFNVVIVGCRRDATREGGVILTLRVDATGGNGRYTYIREGVSVPQISDRPATKGTAVIDAWRVTSGDGQFLEKKIRFTGDQFGCP